MFPLHWVAEILQQSRNTTLIKGVVFRLLEPILGHASSPMTRALTHVTSVRRKQNLVSSVTSLCTRFYLVVKSGRCPGRLIVRKQADVDDALRVTEQVLAEQAETVRRSSRGGYRRRNKWIDARRARCGRTSWTDIIRDHPIRQQSVQEDRQRVLRVCRCNPGSNGGGFEDLVALAGVGLSWRFSSRPPQSCRSFDGHSSAAARRQRYVRPVVRPQRTRRTQQRLQHGRRRRR